jgi:hypothetical protein
MPRDFLPRRDADLRSWAANFAAAISSDPAAYGLSIEQAAAFQARQAAFDAAYELATAPATRTRSTVTAKDEARRSLEREARVLAGIVRARSDVSNEQRVNLGVSQRRQRRGRIPAPVNRPVVHVSDVRGTRFALRLSDPGGLGRGRPPGVAGATVFVCIADAPPNSLDQWSFATQTTRTACTVVVGPHVPPGSRVWFSARWFNPRAELGPPGEPVCACTQFGIGSAPAPQRLAA